MSDSSSIQPSAISKGQASIEVENWLSYKKVSTGQREELAEYIKALIDFISDGCLVLNADMSFTHILKFPVGVGESVTELSYRARIKPKELKPYLSGVKSSDSNGTIYAHMCALSNQNSGIITELDQEDIKIGRSIAIFFV